MCVYMIYSKKALIEIIQKQELAIRQLQDKMSVHRVVELENRIVDQNMRIDELLADNQYWHKKYSAYENVCRELKDEIREYKMLLYKNAIEDTVAANKEE